MLMRRDLTFVNFISLSRMFIEHLESVNLLKKTSVKSFIVDPLLTISNVEIFNASELLENNVSMILTWSMRSKSSTRHLYDIPLWRFKKLEARKG